MGADVFSNLLGVAGLAAVAVAVGALTGNWWWSALAGGVFAVALAAVAQYNGTRHAEDVPAEVTPLQRPRSRSA